MRNRLDLSAIAAPTGIITILAFSAACRTTGGPSPRDVQLLAELDRAVEPSEIDTLAERIDPGPLPPIREVVPELLRYDPPDHEADAVRLMREDVKWLRSVVENHGVVFRATDVATVLGRSLYLAETVGDAEATSLGLEMYQVLDEAHESMALLRLVQGPVVARGLPGALSAVDAVLEARPALERRDARLGSRLLRTAPDHPDVLPFLVRWAKRERGADPEAAMQALALATRIQRGDAYAALEGAAHLRLSDLDADHARRWVERAERAAAADEVHVSDLESLVGLLAAIERLTSNATDDARLDAYHFVIDHAPPDVAAAAVRYAEREFPGDVRVVVGRASRAYYEGRLDGLRRDLALAARDADVDGRYWALAVTERLLFRALPAALAVMGQPSPDWGSALRELAQARELLEGLKRHRPNDAELLSIIFETVAEVAAPAPDAPQDGGVEFFSAVADRALPRLLTLRERSPEHVPTQLVTAALSTTSRTRELALAALERPPESVLAREDAAGIWRRAAVLVALRWSAWDRLDALAETFPEGSPRSVTELEDQVLLQRAYVLSGHTEHSWLEIARTLASYLDSHEVDDGARLRSYNNLAVAAHQAGELDLATGILNQLTWSPTAPVVLNRARVAAPKTWVEDLFGLEVDPGDAYARLVNTLRVEHARTDEERAAAESALVASSDQRADREDGLYGLDRLCIFEGPSMNLGVGFSSEEGFLINVSLDAPLFWLIPPCQLP